MRYTRTEASSAVSQNRVYESLKMLDIAEKNVPHIIINDLAYGSGCSCYDACTRRHDHAFCTECGALLDIPQEVQLSTKALQVAAHSTDFELGSYEVRIYGRCSTCRSRRSE